MSVMEKLKNLFQSADLPEETRQIYNRAASPRELLKELEALRGRNEIDLRECEEQLLGVEKAIALEEQAVRRGGLTPTEETIALRRIERLQKHRANSERQAIIYNENVNLHMNLIAKIQELEAMRSRGVAEEEIDRLIEEVETSVTQYKRVGIAAESGAAASSAVDESAERRRLEELKRRILGGGKGERAEPARAPKDRSME